jgi:hypothetical protein
VTTAWYDDDSLLLDALSGALGVTRQVPARVVRDAKAVYTWRLIDAEIAQVAYDSTVDQDAALAGLRAETAPLRMLSFQAGDIAIELGVAGDALTGQVVPASTGTIDLRTADAAGIRVPVDDLGCFTISPPPMTPFTLRLTLPSGRIVVTPSATL